MSRRPSDYQVVIDRRGEMTKSAFYLVSNFEYLILTQEDIRMRRVLHPRGVSSVREFEERDFHSAEITSSDETSDERFQCPNNHLRQQLYSKLSGYVSYLKNLADFVMDPWSPLFVVSDEFRRRLEATNLRGTSILQFEYKWNPGPPKPVDMPLWVFQFLGRNCERFPLVVGVENLCPHCRAHVIVCMKCGYLYSVCSKTDQVTMQSQASRKSRPVAGALLAEDYFPEEKILDGCRWDGSDFVQSHSWRYMSHRAVEWLTRIHAGPLLALPVRFCLDDMTDQQKRWLDEIRDPMTVREA